MHQISKSSRIIKVNLTNIKSLNLSVAIRNIISISYYSCLWEAIALNKNARESVPSSRSIQNFNWDSSILNVPVFDNFKQFPAMVGKNLILVYTLKVYG